MAAELAAAEVAQLIAVAVAVAVHLELLELFT
jgi:hypothetical protein